MDLCAGGGGDDGSCDDGDEDVKACVSEDILMYVHEDVKTY